MPLISLVGIELQHIVVSWGVAIIVFAVTMISGGPTARALSAVALTMLLLVAAGIALPWFISDH